MNSSFARVLARWQHTRLSAPDGSSFWYRLQQNDARKPWLCVPTDWAMYGGHGGVLLVSLSLASESAAAEELGASLWVEFVEDVGRSEFANESPSTGWTARTFHGLSGLLYMLAVGAHLSGDRSPRVKRAAAGMVQSLTRADTSESDLMDGHAGVLRSIRAAALAGILEDQELYCDATDLLIYKLRESLVERGAAEPRRAGWLTGEEGPLGGLAHGYAGIALALGVPTPSHDRDVESVRLELLQLAVSNQVSLLSREDWSWRDLRPASPLINPLTSAWCHGGEGISLAVLANPEPWGLSVPVMKQVIEAALTGVQTDGLSLCHGAAGRATLFGIAENWAANNGVELSRESREVGWQARERLRAALSVAAWSVEAEDVSLMTGRPGMLLALERPEIANAALTLDLPGVGENCL